MAEDFHHPTILLTHETSLQLLVQHLAILPPWPQHLVTLKNPTLLLAVDAFSLCLRNCSSTNVVELLEQGCGVFWSQLTLQSPLDDVILVSSLVGKSLADEFRQLALLIHNALKFPGADQPERLCCLNLKLRTVVTNICNLPGLSWLLLPALFPDL